MLDFTLPTLGDLSTPQGQEQVKSYLYQLTDQLKFALSHIDRENLSDALAKQYENTVTVAESLARIDESLQQFQGKSNLTAQEISKGLTDQKDKLAEYYEELKAALADQADTVMNDYQSAVENSKEEFSSTFSESYTLKSETATMREEIESKFLQNAQQIMMIFSQAYDVETDSLENFASRFQSYIRFTMDGIELGKEGSGIVAQLSNESLDFVQKGTGESGFRVAYISKKKLYITEANITSALTLGAEAHGFFYQGKTDPQYGFVLNRINASEVENAALASL